MSSERPARPPRRRTGEARGPSGARPPRRGEADRQAVLEALRDGLADLVLERSTTLTALPWANHRSPLWEPEPLRFAGANLGVIGMHDPPRDTAVSAVATLHAGYVVGVGTRRRRSSAMTSASGTGNVGAAAR